MKNSNRRQFLKTTIATVAGLSAPAIWGSEKTQTQTQEQIKAFCVDFNWDHDIKWEGRPWAKPGRWAEADPAEHVRWHKELGCNAIVSFAVSCNGYAWYKNSIVPEQPGLKHDFLTDMVRLGHKEGMKIFGYFCFGANWLWRENNPSENYGGSIHSYHIPFTNKYLDYICASIEDAFKKTGMDGLRIDWLWNPDKIKWLTCEQEMYVELMGEKFPGTDNISKEQLNLFRKKSLNRCWQRMYETTKNHNKNNIVWHSINNFNHRDLVGDSVPMLMLQQSDWLTNEAGDLESLKKVAAKVGKQTRLVTCMARWNNQDVVKTIDEINTSNLNVGLYGFTKPTNGTLPPPISSYLAKPVESFTGDDKNIAVFARVHNNLPLDYVLIQ
ncbi:MAG: hypothetical protein LBG58_14645 [Planctomycetaceae bacterium]|jgi:hypothetical protein|nr:hypothetical protein [Planctomycetaceae bacterium]